MIYKGQIPLIEQPKLGSNNIERIFLGDSIVYGSDGSNITPFSTTGGTKTIVGNYTIHSITSSLDFVYIGDSPLQCEVLLVGGGGTGGNRVSTTHGGGGGGGQVLESTLILEPGDYQTIIGDKGGRVGAQNNGFTRLHILTAVSGGDGSNGGANENGFNGASGGGAGANSSERDGGTGIAGGNGGRGSGGGATTAGAGGGAQPQNGSNALGSTPPGSGNGGNGKVTTIRETSETFGGGGSGTSASGPSPLGGTGGGGTQNSYGIKATGGGGGGRQNTAVEPLGDLWGGSGIVIIKYLTP